MENNNLTPEESLQIISKSIANFKTNYKESSQIFLLWGWVLTLASFSGFVSVNILLHKEAYNLIGPFMFGIWGGFSLIGFVIMYFLKRKINKEKKVYSFIEEINEKLSWVSVVAFAITIFLCVKLEINPPPLMLLIAGILTLKSGILIKFKPLIIGGIAFFIFSIASAFVSFEYVSLVVCISIIIGYLIPGYLLKSAK